MHRDVSATSPYHVLVDDDGQFLVWPADRATPIGWRETGADGTQAECLAHVDQVCTDRRVRAFDVPQIDDQARLLEALLRGDETAFAALVNRYHAALVRLALGYVRDRAIAEEVAQDTWLGVLRGVHQFAGRASLKTWIFRILINRARYRAARERHTIPFSVAWDVADEPFQGAVAPERFRKPGEQWPGGWVSVPTSWGDTPEERLLTLEVRARIRAAIDRLPPSQREVVQLRDVQGWTATEVCEALQVSQSNQRVLLHRGRSRLRQALEEYLAAP